MIPTTQQPSSLSAESVDQSVANISPVKEEETSPSSSSKRKKPENSEEGSDPKVA